MAQVMAATFKDGVFKPDLRPALSDSARVRLVVEPIGADERELENQSWSTLRSRWSSSHFSSGGDYLTRDELHERG